MTALPSIKARLALISAAIIVTVLSVAGIALVILFDTYIERRIEQELTSRLLDLSGFLDVNKSGEPVITGFPSDPARGRDRHWQHPGCQRPLPAVTVRVHGAAGQPSPEPGTWNLCVRRAHCTRSPG